MYGYADAQYELGEAYYRGCEDIYEEYKKKNKLQKDDVFFTWYVDQDYEEAVTYWRKAAEQGHLLAKKRLEELGL